MLTNCIHQQALWLILKYYMRILPAGSGNASYTILHVTVIGVPEGTQK